MTHDHCHIYDAELDYGFPTVFGRGLLGEFKHFVNPPFLVVTMEDLWPMFGHHFEGADCRPYFCGSIEQEDLNREAANLGEVRAIVGLGGGQALDVAKYFAWRLNLPFFQAPTALSVNAVYGQRAGVRVDGKVLYRGWAVPQAIYIDYDVLATCPPALNWSGIGDILCFHSGVLDWRYAEAIGKIEAKWCPRHIEGTDHFLFYTLEKLTGKKFLHGQPVGLGVVVGSMLHEAGAEEMLDTISGIGLDVRPEAMGLSWDQLTEGLKTMKSYVNQVGLWHSIAHDAAISDGFIADLRRRLQLAYAYRAD